MLFKYEYSAMFVYIANFDCIINDKVSSDVIFVGVDKKIKDFEDITKLEESLIVDDRINVEIKSLTFVGELK